MTPVTLGRLRSSSSSSWGRERRGRDCRGFPSNVVAERNDWRIHLKAKAELLFSDRWASLAQYRLIAGPWLRIRGEITK
jgi:hypothetical protein